MTATSFQKRTVATPPASAAALATQPLLVLLGARALYLGAGLQLSPHRNAVATWVLGLDETFELSRFDTAGGETHTVRQALIPAGARHHLQSQGRVLFLYVDALSADLAALSAAVDHDLAALIAAAEALLAAPDPQAVLAGTAALLTALDLHAGAPCASSIAATIRAIDQRPQAFPTLARAARHAGLSPSRFQHQLRSMTGVPFRRYRLLRRMAQVMRGLDAGQSLTEAALDAGFSSSAHLSTAFRDLFGLSPSMLMAANLRLVIGGDDPWG